MKVLYAATVYSHFCEFHLPYMKEFKERGYEVHVVGHDNLGEKNGLKLQNVDKNYDIPFTRSPLTTDNLKAYKQLKEIIKKEKYDIIVCNTPMGGILTRLAARKLRKNGTKVYYIAHGFHFYSDAPKKNWLVFYPIEKFFGYLTDELITITKEDFDLASKKFKCPVSRIHGIGVDANRYFAVDTLEKAELRKQMGYNESQKLILCIGEFNDNKNQIMAVDMMKDVAVKYPDALLLFAGTGPNKEMLEAKIKEYAIEKNIEFLGYCTHLQDYQHIVDMVISCSKREGLPLNIVESMLSKNPVVVASNRGHRELVKNGQNGYVVPVGDSSSMAKHIIEIFDDSEKSEAFGNKGNEMAQLYTCQNVKNELIKIFFDEEKQ